MKGVAFLDVDGGLGFRTQEFLDNTDPMFMTNNHAFILKAWRFDTDNFDLMYDMFRALRDLKLTSSAVVDLARAIGFDVARLKEGR